jgi:4-amino-4-deoxy-L-arabinose transferase-like glycosyltransferase
MSATPGRRPIWQGSAIGLFVLPALALGALFVVGLADGSLPAGPVLWLFWAGVGMLLLTSEVGYGHFRRFARQLWVAFSARTLLAAILHVALAATPYWPWWDFGSLGGDELVFWSTSDFSLSAWIDGGFRDLPPLTNAPAWVHLIGFNRFVGSLVGGDSVFSARLPLCLASALIVPYVYAIALRLYGPRVARIAGGLAFWFPEFWFYSATLMRDIMIPGLLVVILHQVIEIVHVGFSLRRLLLAVALNFGVLRYFRNDLAFLAFGLVIVFIIWGQAGRRIRLRQRVLATAGLAAGVVALLAAVAPRTYSLEALASDPMFQGWYLEHRLNVERELGLEEAGSGSFGVGILRMPLYIGGPIQSASVMLNPFPPWAGVVDRRDMFPLKAFMTLVSAVVWFALIPFFAAGLVISLKDSRRTVWVWGTVVIMGLMLGITMSTHARWRLALMPFALILAAEGLGSGRRRQTLWMSVWACLTVAMLVYAVLKYLR